MAKTYDELLELVLESKKDDAAFKAYKQSQQRKSSDSNKNTSNVEAAKNAAKEMIRKSERTKNGYRTQCLEKSSKKLQGELTVLTKERDMAYEKYRKTISDALEDIADSEKSSDSSGKKDTAGIVKIAAAATILSVAVGSGVAFLSKHFSANSESRALAKRAKKLQKEIIDIDKQLKSGEITRREAVRQIKSREKEFNHIMKEIESLSKSKSVKESVDFDTDLEDEILHVFEYARDSGLNDSEIYEVLESAFGEESLHDFANFDEPKTYDAIHSICEAVEAGEIDINDGLELIELLENTN